MLRLELENMLKGENRFALAIERGQHAAQRLPQFGIIGLELNCLVEHGKRVFEPSDLLQHKSQR